MAALCGDVFISKLRKFRLSFAVFQYSKTFLIYPTILCKFFTLAKKFAGVRIIVVFLFIYIYIYIFFNFRVYQTSSVFWFWSLERIFHKKSPNSRRWRGETSAMMGSAETRNCVSKVFVRCLHLKNLHSRVCGTSLLSALALHKMNNSLRCWREIGP